MKTIYILAAIALGISAHASAQTTTDSVYSLSRCKELALENNAAAKTSQCDLEAATETRKEAFTKYFPEISAGGSWFKTNTDIIKYDVLDYFTLGVIDKGKAAGVWALQPVFMGGRIVNGNKLAKVGEEAAQIRRQQTNDEILLQTEALYWQLVTLKATRGTVESAITMLDSLAAQANVAVETGVMMPNEALKVDIQRNKYLSDMVDLDNGISLVKMLLAQQIGIGTDAPIDIREEVPEETPAYPSSMHVSSSTALPDTYDYQLLQKNVEAKSLEKKMEQGNYLPSVAVGAGWFYHDVFDQDHNFGGVMLTGSVPISGWWGGSHAIKRKNLELENARTEMNDLSRKLEIDMADKWDNVTAAHNKMRIAAESIRQSKENLRLNRAYYEAGMSTITDLLDAQTLYRQAQSDYISAYGVFRMSQSQYLNATGRL
ncbi:MAG: TolC family protein [Muribaculaceae bacterium]|nr:TolC family protein [Muribaculaceae bacterium]